MIGAAVDDALTPIERDAAHARAARCWPMRGLSPTGSPRTCCGAPPAGDPLVVSALRDAARRAGPRGASESAVAYLRRALAEPPDAGQRAELLLELGSAEALVDGEAAAQHLGAARELIDDPARKAAAGLLLGRQLFLLRGEEGDAVLIEALDDLAGADAELERLLEARLIANDLFVPSLHRHALRRLERVRDRPADSTFGEKVLLSLLAYHDARAGAPAAEVVPLARRALSQGTLIAGDASGAAIVPPATVLAMADLDEVLPVYEDALATAHRRGSTLAFVAVKVFRAQTLVWRGDLGEAAAEAREALAAAETWGPSARSLGHSAAFLADALMEQGDLDGAAAALARVGSGESLAESARLLYLRDSRARLRILRGDPAGGAEDLLDAGRRFEAVGSRNPAFIAWRSPAALALLQLGEEDEARRLATEELALARAWGAPRALGAALRGAGLAEGGASGRALLEEAVEVLSSSPARLEHAKARAELGAALRRANRRSEARDHLRQAVELATICGAAPVAARAETELLATGARPRRIALSGVESLTPQRAPRRRDGRRGADEPRDRPSPLRHPEDRGGPPHEHLPEAGDQLAVAAPRRAARCGANGLAPAPRRRGPSPGFSSSMNSPAVLVVFARSKVGFHSTSWLWERCGTRVTGGRRCRDSFVSWWWPRLLSEWPHRQPPPFPISGACGNRCSRRRPLTTHSPVAIPASISGVPLRRSAPSARRSGAP